MKTHLTYKSDYFTFLAWDLEKYKTCEPRSIILSQKYVIFLPGNKDLKTSITHFFLNANVWGNCPKRPNISQFEFMIKQAIKHCLRFQFLNFIIKNHAPPSIFIEHYSVLSTIEHTENIALALEELTF